MPAFLQALSTRDLEPELMDQPGLDPGLHRRALRGLERINRFSRSGQILWPPIRDLARSQPDRPLTLLDVATGAGDLPVALSHQANRHNVQLTIEACDISTTALDHARINAERSNAAIHFFQHDPLASPLPRTCDIVIASLFLHHLDEAQAVTLLQRMAEAARSLVIINDLARSRPGWLLAWFGTRLLSRSPIVHYDGPQSVAAAFTANEARDLAARAGLARVEISHHWPFRYRLLWRRS